MKLNIKFGEDISTGSKIISIVLIILTDRMSSFDLLTKCLTLEVKGQKMKYVWN